MELPAKVFSLPRPDGLQHYYPAMFAEVRGIAEALYPVGYFRVEKDARIIIVKIENETDKRSFHDLRSSCLVKPDQVHELVALECS